MSKKKQCKLNKAFFTPCDTLEKMIQDTRGKGVSYFTLSNIETGKVTRSAANLKSGEFSKRGVLMNFCPFCGNAVCVPCREQIKKRYPECYENMILVTPYSSDTKEGEKP